MRKKTIQTLVVTSLISLGINTRGEEPAVCPVTSKSSVAVVLVGHGAPPKDFPREKLMAAMQATSSHGHSHGPGTATHTHSQKDANLGKELLNWPRTPKNDPYFYGVQSIAKALQKQSGLPVLVGFNEFCAPTTNDAIDAAIRAGAKNVVVTTVMLTPGGGHSERDIRASIDQAKKDYPKVNIKYAWPYAPERIATILNLQVKDFLPDKPLAQAK